MGPILAGVIVLVLILILLRGFVTADPKALAKVLRQSGAVALGIFAVFFILTGRFFVSILVAGFAWFLFRGGQVWPEGWNPFGSAAPPQSDETSRPRSASGMTPEEARKILGLREGAAAADIHAAHQRLMQQYEPHQVGSDYFAAKINEARDVLLSPRSV